MSETKQTGILIVDDEVGIREMLKFILESKNYENIYFASTGLEAIENLKKYPINVVILDIMMPEMNGFETLQRIREFRKDIHVIMYSAYSSFTDIITSFELGADDFICKVGGDSPAEEIIESVNRATLEQKPKSYIVKTTVLAIIDKIDKITSRIDELEKGILNLNDKIEKLEPVHKRFLNWIEKHKKILLYIITSIIIGLIIALFKKILSL